MHKIIYTGPQNQLAAARLAAGDGIDVAWVAAEPAAIASALHDADGVIDASMRVKISSEMIAAAPKLKVISCATTGADHIEVGTDGRVAVFTLREAPELLAGLTPAAELSWALVLACARNLPAANAHVRSGHWVREDFPGLMLNGRRLGIIGCGRIGGWMLRYGEAFGMNRVGYDPHIDPPTGVAKASLNELFETCDVISLHVHLSDTTRGMITEDHFNRVKQGAVFINTSRGALIDENALLRALESGRLGAAGLDVLDGEPEIIDHPLRRYGETHDNLLITPHCGGFSPDAVAKVVAHAARRAARHLIS